MEKFSEWMEEHLGPIAAKIANNRFIMIVSRAFNIILPVSMCGSLVTLVNYITIGNFQEILTNAGVKDLVNIINTFSTNCIALYLSAAIGYFAARAKLSEGESFTVGLIGMFLFILATPVNASTINLGYFGSKGLFSALIISFTGAKLYIFLTEKGLAFKLPDSVPPFVAESFKGILPTIILSVLVAVINRVIQGAGFPCITDAILSVLQKPFQTLSSSIWTSCFCSLMTALLWWCGIHGGNVMGGITSLLFTEATLENVAAGAAGLPLPNIVTKGLGSVVGSGGQQFATAAALLLFCKREDLRAIGKIAIVPGIFNISEPNRFGIPVVLNAYLFIPQVFTLPFLNLVAYFLVKANILSRPRIQGVFGTPIFLEAFLMGGWRSLIASFFSMAYMIIVWAIFLKLYENHLNERDAADAGK